TCWRIYNIASDGNFLRLDLTGTDNGTVQSRAHFTGHRAPDFGQGHFVRALVIDGFNDVATANARFVRRSTGNHRDHGCISEAFGNGGANGGLAISLLLLEYFVLSRAEIAGVGIQRLQ